MSKQEIVSRNCPHCRGRGFVMASSTPDGPKVSMTCGDCSGIGTVFEVKS